MEKVIITVAPVGAETTREDNPAVPLTPGEIARDVEACAAAGASIVHLHVRDASGRPTQDPEVFREAVRAIRERCDVIVQVSTGGAVGAPPETRASSLGTRPEMATLTCGSVNFGDGVFANPLPFIVDLATRMNDLGIKPEVEVFEPGMIETARRLMEKGILAPPLHFDLVLGVPGASPATPESLAHMVSCLPPGATWQVAAIGRHELPMAMLAVAMGGHVRVGFEDNVYYLRGVLARDNAQLVARIARIAGESGRGVAGPGEARRILGLGAAPSAGRNGGRGGVSC